MFKKIKLPKELIEENEAKEATEVKATEASETKTIKTTKTNETKEINTNWVPPKKNIGPSQFAAALGLNKFLDSSTLRHRLEKGYISDPLPCLEFGKQHEKLAKYYYQKLSGNRIKPSKFVKDQHCPHIIGICDGLIGSDGGIEIKCHYGKEFPLKTVPIYYLIQVAGYLYLYDRKWWDFMSCCFSPSGELMTCRIIRVNWDDIKDAWNDEWYPAIVDFVQSVHWSTF